MLRSHAKYVGWLLKTVIHEISEMSILLKTNRKQYRESIRVIHYKPQYSSREWPASQEGGQANSWDMHSGLLIHE